MIRQTKRQRRERPTSWMDCESLETVPYLNQYIRTPLASELLSELFANRYQTELIQPFGASRIGVRVETDWNECTELLEDSTTDANLVVVSNTDVAPVTCLVHYIVLARQRQIPVLLVPSNAFGSVMVFHKGPPGDQELDDAVDSFVHYIVDKLREDGRSDLEKEANHQERRQETFSTRDNENS